MERLGFYYDMTTCIGCGACQVACKDVHHLNPGEFFRRVETLETDDGGHGKRYHFSGACYHCAEPACVEACPTGAMYTADDGTVRHDDGKCIGCGACMWNCPYGAISFSQTKGVAQKCDACYERRKMGQAPACVAACITHSLKFGKLAEFNEESTVRALPFLPSPEQTDPAIKIRVPEKLQEQIARVQKGGQNERQG